MKKSMSGRTSLRRVFLMTAGVGASIAALVSAGCFSSSNGTWYIRSAPLPQGWPDLTPVGAVELRTYPQYRAATVDDGRNASGMPIDESAMFMTLFRHIKRQDIAMTAPVDMTYTSQFDESGDPTAEQAASETPALMQMAFLYRAPDVGRPGTDGDVEVREVPPQTWASIGIRGSYSERQLNRSLARIEAWLTEHPEWQARGGARLLGYNGPFTLPFLRYGEVQVPVYRSERESRGPVGQ